MMPKYKNTEEGCFFFQGEARTTLVMFRMPKTAKNKKKGMFFRLIKIQDKGMSSFFFFFDLGTAHYLRGRGGWEKCRGVIRFSLGPIGGVIKVFFT